MEASDLLEILQKEEPSTEFRKKCKEKQIFKLIPELESCKGFEQTSKWHIYDVYEHILHVVDSVPNDLELRLSALFHDIGKPSTYKIDEQGRGHFPHHWLVSADIFKGFAQKNNLDNKLTETVIKLITYHDIDIDRLTDREELFLTYIFTKEELEKLFILKKADLLAHSKEYHYLEDIYEKQKTRVLKRYERG